MLEVVRENIGSIVMQCRTRIAARTRLYDADNHKRPNVGHEGVVVVALPVEGPRKPRKPDVCADA